MWRSERFQNLIHGVSQARLSEALGVPVDFDTVDVRLLPPSVALVNVKVGNDPALHLPEDRPLLTAEEISIGGGRSLAGGELRLGRIRALRPRILLEQGTDGRWNLPPGLSGPSRKAGGIKVTIASLLVQEGYLDFRGRRIALDGTLEEFAAELVSTRLDEYRGTLVARRGTFRLPKKEPIVAGLGLRFAIEGGRGVTVDELKLEGDFGRITASGSLESLESPRLALLVSGDVSIEEVERLFHSSLGFEGRAAVRARVEVAFAGGFRITGTLTSARAHRAPFTLQDVVASVTASPDQLLAKIERARYAGGEAQGAFRIAELVGAQTPMTLALDGTGIALESFFADLNLPGTGLAGSARLQASLRWGPEGISRADGGGRLEISALPAVSQVRGRFGIPTDGGGPLSIRDGSIGFEGCSLKFPHSTLDFTGKIPIGGWQPDFDFAFRSRDFAEADRIFQNFVAATGGKPSPLGLGGSGAVEGRIERSWSDPQVTARISAEEARYAGVLFGSTRGTVDMSEGAFLFRPLRVYEGAATLSLEGRAAFRDRPGRAPLDLVVSARRYPLARLLDYLDLDLPISGEVSGSFPLQGSKEALAGGGEAELVRAVVWGQPFERITGRAVLTPGRFDLEEVRAPVGEGMIGGRGSIALHDKRFEARAAGDQIALDAIEILKPYARDLDGKISFQVSGSGSLDRPDLTVSGSLADSTFYGHPVPAESEPFLSAKIENGRLEGEVSVANGFRLTASGEIYREGAPIEVALDATSLASLLRFTPAELPDGYGGSLAVSGSIVLPFREGDWATGRIRVTRAIVDMRGRPAALRTRGDVDARLQEGRLAFEPFVVEGEGMTVSLSGSVGLAKPFDLALKASGPIDPSLLALAMPDLSLTGSLRLAIAAAGPLAAPKLSGEITLKNGRYRLPGLSQILDDIDGTIHFGGAGSGEVEARAKVGGGEAYAAGTFGLDGLALTDFRLTLQGRRITVRYSEDMRLLLDADLVATGGSSGNVVRGEIVLLRGTYTRDIDLTLSDLLGRSRPAGSVGRDPWKERTRLEVHLVSSQSLEVRNNLARLTGTVDLLARGTLADPGLVGQVTLDEGGRVTFRDVRYEIESGTMTFASTRGLAPILDLRARAEVKGYDLAVNVAGTWPRVETTFSSDPPLSDEAIVNLLLTGTRPGPAPAAELSGVLASTAGSIVGSAATGVVTRPAQKLFKLERFQIDPIFTASGLAGATTTVGKQISPNWSVTYSQPLFEAGIREPIVEIEGRISQTWVLRLRKDENGVYLMDLRRRVRP